MAKAFQTYDNEQDAKDLAVKLNAKAPANRRFEVRPHSFHEYLERGRWQSTNMPETWGVVEWETDYKDSKDQTIGRLLGFVRA